MNLRARKRQIHRALAARPPRFSLAAHAWTHRLQQLEAYRAAAAPRLREAFMQAYLASQRTA